MARLCHRMCDQQYQKSPIGAPDRLPSLLSIKAAMFSSHSKDVALYVQFSMDTCVSDLEYLPVCLKLEYTQLYEQKPWLQADCQSAKYRPQ